MLANRRLMRVFWPSDTPRGRTGVLIGWLNSELDFFVVACLLDVEARQVEHALQVGLLFRNSAHPLSEILERCAGRLPHSLGSLNPTTAPAAFDENKLVAFSLPRSRLPRIYCPHQSGITVQVILFDRPQPSQMQYLSLKPISLALGDKVDDRHRADGTLDTFEVEEEKERQRKRELVDKLKFHIVVRYPSTEHELKLPQIIEQVNCSVEIASLLQSNIGLVGPRTKRGLSVSERVVESATDLLGYIAQGVRYVLLEWLLPVLHQLFIVALIGHRSVAEMILLLLEWRPAPTSPALKDISATAQQMDLRLQQFCYWPIQYFTLRNRKARWESINNDHPEYIRFFNSLWLVANDIIIGIALGSFIVDNSDFVAAQVDTVLQNWSIEGLSRTIAWLMDWPAGLKLNNELATFLGDLFLWVIDYWAGCIAALRPALPTIIRFIGYAGFAGATMPISIFSDLTSLLTLDIYSFYIASARIWNWQLTIIISLFHLFRGKKRNVLRNRIDSCDYELDQLLLGTILFTLLFFLIPTVFVFYLTFASARMSIIALKALLDTALACLNHFPLFALMLRIKDSRRLPACLSFLHGYTLTMTPEGGIRFDLLDAPATNMPDHRDFAPSSYIALKSVPLSLRATFDQYFQLGNRIRKHYISPGNFLRFVTGRFVPPIHRRNLYSLQYSMLPARRVPISELWLLLKLSRVKAGPQLAAVAKGHVKMSFASGSSHAHTHTHRSARNRARG